MAVLVVIAGGSLGMYPCYYSFTQELTARSMGKLTGMLSFSAWAISSPIQSGFGWLADNTGSHDLGFALAGLPALVPVVLLLLFWRHGDPPQAADPDVRAEPVDGDVE